MQQEDPEKDIKKGIIPYRGQPTLLEEVISGNMYSSIAFASEWHDIGRNVINNNCIKGTIQAFPFACHWCGTLL